jgi:hypothetical protein
VAETFFSGVTAWVAAVDKMLADVGVATGQAVAEGAAAIQTQARINASGRPGPNVRSGALRAGITVEGPLPQGFGGFIAYIRSTVRYGRAIEEGHPRWKTGNKFPYLGPAYTYVTNVALPVIFERAWARALRRGT